MAYIHDCGTPDAAAAVAYDDLVAIGIHAFQAHILAMRNQHIELAERCEVLPTASGVVTRVKFGPEALWVTNQ